MSRPTDDFVYITEQLEKLRARAGGNISAAELQQIVAELIGLVLALNDHHQHRDNDQGEF